MFGLMYGATGSFDLTPFTPSQFSPAYASAVFLLALFGFGLKAGIMPLHFWLPSAHAMAPSHVSAMMSGVLIKMGIYGLVRVTGLLPDPPLWWGSLVLTLGTLSSIFGVVFALSQHDLKRLLAYSSIENIGIMAIGLGLALLGRSVPHPVVDRPGTFGSASARLESLPVQVAAVYGCRHGNPCHPYASDRPSGRLGETDAGDGGVLLYRGNGSLRIAAV